MPDLLSDADVFTPGETVNVYQGRDESLNPYTTVTAAADGSAAVVSLPAFKTYTLRGLTSGVRRRMFAEDALEPGASPEGFAELPIGIRGARANLALTANRAYLLLLPRECLGRVATGIGFLVEQLPTGEEPIDVGFYRADAGKLTKLGSSGPLAGRLNYPTFVHPSGGGSDEYQYPTRAPQATGPPIRLPSDAAVYAAFAVGALSASPSQLSGSDMGLNVYGPGGQSQMAPGLVKALYMDAAYPLPATISEAPGLKTVPNLVVQFVHRIVGLGDSIMRGDPTGATLSSRLSIPTKLNERLGPHAWILNAGIGSEKVADFTARVGVVNEQKPSEVLILGGINDLNAARTDTQIIADLTTLYQAVEAAGAQVIAIPILPYGSSGFWTAPNEAYRVSVNNWIKNTSGRRYVNLEAVVGETTTFGPGRPRLQTAYAFDGIHLNGAGMDAAADAIFRDSRGYAASIAPRL